MIKTIQDYQVFDASNEREEIQNRALGISEEIDAQNKLLENLDTDLEKANENVDRITQMTKALVKKSGGSRGFCIIIVLSVILVFLIFLCIYS